MTTIKDKFDFFGWKFIYIINTRSGVHYSSNLRDIKNICNNIQQRIQMV